MSTTGPKNTSGLPNSVASKRQLKREKNRARLLAATKEIFSEGKKVTIAAAAERAGISVPTAYRFYSDPEKMRHDAALNQRFGPDPETRVAELREACEGIDDPLERLIIAQDMMLEFIEDNETAYRMFLASSYESIVRSGEVDHGIAAGGRRVYLIDCALEPVRDELNEEQYNDLICLLMIVMGPEPYFTLHDFSGKTMKDVKFANHSVIRYVFEGFMTEVEAAG